MNLSARTHRVSELVEAALELEPGDRPAFLSEACREDAALRSEVESLLGYQTQAAHFIEKPAYQSSAELLVREDDEDEGQSELKPGELLGEYKIVSLLGSGGMGEVYLAEDAALGRRVAIKLIKRGFGTSDFIRRFRREERILAGLNHPHIARLYGGAVTAAGLPYFVMEHVAGIRLDQYCDEHRLDLAQRLQLFRQVCSAVSYAHQHLIIHRDLKPVNILVTPDGAPKLLDFGIARLLDDEEAPAATITMASVMTPDYASPEQVRGERMTTGSDIYSLGVILYELLAGAKPYRVSTSRVDEISRAITDQEPTRPSTAAAANLKSQISNFKSLKGDLDNIILMALRKEPARRYASVAQFSEDIRRHLDGLPVIARKDTWRYRSGKFVRRNKAGVLAAVLIVATLLGGIVATARQARIAQAEHARAEQRFNDVRKLANSYLFEIHDAIENLPGSTPARALLVKRALEYLDSLAREARSDPSLQREVAMAYLKVGNVQGNPNNANLGDSAGALESYRKALQAAEPLARETADAFTRRPLALIFEKMADVEAHTGQVPRAVQSARRSLEIFQELARANPGDAAAQLSVAISHLKTGDILGNPNFVNAGDRDGAMQAYREAARILETLHDADPTNPKTRRFLGMIHERIGAILEAQRDGTGALTAYQKSAAIRVPLAAEFPHDTTMGRDAAIAYEKIGNALAARGDLEKALENRRTSLDLFRALFQVDPRNTMAQHSLAVSHIHLADLLGGPDLPNLGRRSEAEENYQQAAGMLDAINRADAANAAAREDFNAVQAKLRGLTGK